MSNSPPRLRENLRASSWDGALFGGMVGLGETYLAPFALAVGMGEISAGLVASVPMVAGGAMQLVSLRAVDWLGSEKRWILISATIQALAFVPLFVAAMVGGISLPALLLIASIYWGAGLATGPAWNSWIETIVPAGLRPRYFASRTKLSQLVTLGGFLLGGTVLTISGKIDRECEAYAVLFAAAGLLRFGSVYWLSRHRGEPTGEPVKPILSPANGSSMIHGGRLLIFLVTLQGMVQLAGPFFTPFMLRELGFSYLQFVTLISVSFIAKVLSLSMWGRLTQRGTAKLPLWIGAIGVAPVSALWMVSYNYLWLIFIHAFSGVMWAAFELGFFLLFFESLPRQRRVRMLTIYNFGNTVAICVGASLGAWILSLNGTTESGYVTLFAVSALGRIASLLILASASLASVPVLKVHLRVLGLRASSGSVDTPVLSSFDQDARPAEEHLKAASS